MSDMNDIPESRRSDLLRYAQASSAERARLLEDLLEKNPGMAGIVAELEAYEELHWRFEVALALSAISGALLAVLAFLGVRSLASRRRDDPGRGAG